MINDAPQHSLRSLRSPTCHDAHDAPEQQTINHRKKPEAASACDAEKRGEASWPQG